MVTQRRGQGVCKDGVSRIHKLLQCHACRFLFITSTELNVGTQRLDGPRVSEPPQAFRCVPTRPIRLILQAGDK